MMLSEMKKKVLRRMTRRHVETEDLMRRQI